ncbi:RiPP maturation radical SAM C-methyltransferase [Actinoplanes sp. NPDC051861]|uniref:RiPP maturation radical SAM C-methyltransferase n=1 Tax=Actinoplanes sp. NPDC051861 TaxID=3155170 RepID=UPI00344300A0
MPGTAAGCPVVLVSMPFMAADRPSIQLGLLKAVLEAHGFPAHTLHANLDLAALLGAERYSLLAEHRGPMVGEWLFSVEAFGDDAPDPAGRLPDEFADDLGYLGGTALLDLRRRVVPAFLDGLLDAFPWHVMRVVGFSSTFQQNAASFALARRLKRRYPHLFLVFGGANFDGEMGPELVRTVGAMDAAVVGEGDRSLPALLTAIASGKSLADVPGLAYRDGDRVVVTPPAAPAAMDELPPPDYSEYFARAERLGLQRPTAHRTVWIPFESARGCWWGQRHHCTFCGLNGASMRFRAKSPQRLLDELAHQTRRYGSFRFEAVDNILDMRYLRDVFPRLIEDAAGYQIFYETAAMLTRAQLRLLSRAGVTSLQPGLESLSSHVLRLMRKGTTAARNINLLRWARYYGIDVAWNVLWGFPGETPEDYAEQAALVPRLRHLQPPGSAGRIWLERFSPLYAEAAAPAPEPSYRYVYPHAVDLDRVAYFFTWQPQPGDLPDTAYDGIRTAVADWSAAWETGPPPTLTYWSSPGYLQVYDGTRPGHEGTYTFRDTLAEIYLACVDRPVTVAAVRNRLRTDTPAAAIREAVEEFTRRGLMVLDGDRALALALPAVGGR